MHHHTYSCLGAIIIVCVALSPLCGAQEAAITILEPQAQVTHTEQVGQRLIRYYTFVVTFRNDGTATSDNLTFFLTDPDLHNNYTLGSATLAPGQTTSFSKTDFPITTQGAFTLNISYAPTESIPSTPTNTGMHSFTLGETTQKKSTPGFEFAVVALAAVIAGLFYRKKTR